jgi:hypothetical protein
MINIKKNKQRIQKCLILEEVDGNLIIKHISDLFLKWGHLELFIIK